MIERLQPAKGGRMEFLHGGFCSFFASLFFPPFPPCYRREQYGSLISNLKRVKRRCRLQLTPDDPSHPWVGCHHAKRDAEGEKKGNPVPGFPKWETNMDEKRRAGTFTKTRGHSPKSQSLVRFWALECSFTGILGHQM